MKQKHGLRDVTPEWPSDTPGSLLVPGMCVGFLRLPQQGTEHWAACSTETYQLTALALEVQSQGVGRAMFSLRSWGEPFLDSSELLAPDASLWHCLACSWSLPSTVFMCWLSLHLCASPFLIRTPVILGYGPTLLWYFDLTAYICCDPISK